MEDLSKMDFGNSRLGQIIRRMYEQRDGSQEDSGSVREQKGNGDDSMHRCIVCGHTWSIRPDHPNPKLCPECKSTIWNRRDAHRCICMRCGHRWFSTDAHPLRCPSCKSKTWDSEFLMVRCSRCGSVWRDRMDSDTFRCPQCGVVGREELCVVSRYDGRRRYDDSKRKGPVSLNREVVDRVRSVGRENRTEILMCSGLSRVESEILICFMDGEDPVSLAREQGIPLHDVMMTLAPYVRICDEEGAAWS